jgi:hypothetical protein
MSRQLHKTDRFIYGDAHLLSRHAVSPSSRYQPDPAQTPGGKLGTNLKTPGITPSSSQPTKSPANTIPAVPKVPKSGFRAKSPPSRYQGFDDDPAPDLPTPRAGQIITGGKPAPVFRPHPPSNVGKTPENMPPSSVFRPHPPSNVGHAVEARSEQRGPSKPGLPVSPKMMPGNTIRMPGNTIRSNPRPPPPQGMPGKRDPFSHPSGRAPTAKDEPGGFI